MSEMRRNVLVVGGGGIGTITALNLVVGGKSNVTLALRSNYQVVNERGFDIKSVDHGHISSWKPNQIVPKIPNVAAEHLEPFDYIVCVTKNTPDLTPTLVDLVRPSVTPGRSVFVLVQNGFNIEKPLLEAFPQNVVLSGVSMMGSHEHDHGSIVHDDKDKLILSPFDNTNLPADIQQQAAVDFGERYRAGGKTVCEVTDNVAFSRWRKLIYNATWNPICAILQLDTGRMRLADGVEGLIKPAMEEIRAAAASYGVVLPAELVQTMIELDAIDMYFHPSMCVDVSKGNFIEYEVIVGEPLRAGLANNVPMPTLTVIYQLCKLVQWRTKEQKGQIQVPPKGKYA